MLYRLHALCWGWRSYRACAGPVGPIDAVRVLKMGLGLLRWGRHNSFLSWCHQATNLPVLPIHPPSVTKLPSQCHQPIALLSSTQLPGITNPAFQCHQPSLPMSTTPKLPGSTNPTAQCQQPNLQVPPSHPPSATKPSSQCHQCILPISPTHPCSATNPIS